MRIGKVCVPEIVLGVLLAIAIFAGGMVTGSFAPPQSQAEEKGKNASAQQQVGWAGWLLPDSISLYNLILAGLTAVLAGIGVVQIRQTRILERAYLSVNPLGIARYVSGEPFFSCDIGIENVGHLPANDVRWFIDRVFSEDRFLSALEIKQDKFQGPNVIAPGVEARKGGLAIDSDAFYAAAKRGGHSMLYVWGEVRYEDGFGKPRFTRFCFRYNMAGVSRDLSKEGIPKESARYHVHGNDAD